MDDIKISLDASGGGQLPAVVRVDGVVDTMTAGELENVMNSLIDQKRFNIIVAPTASVSGSVPMPMLGLATHALAS